MRFPFKLRTNGVYDVVGFGTNAVDHLIRLPAFPENGSKVELSDHTVAPGGEVASTMVGLRRLGLRTAYAGRFGGDPEGEIGLRSLIDAGVDISYAEIVDIARTQVAFILIDETTGERTISWKRDERLAYLRGDAPIEAAAAGRVLHMTPHDTDACIEMASTARQAGTIVSLDVDNAFDGIEELLPLIDVCIASFEFPKLLTGIDDPSRAIRDIWQRSGCAVTGVTLGSKGSIIFFDGTLIETNGFDVPGGCVDTTGAGDAFRTGFLYGLLNGLEIEEAAATANAVAALKCRRQGSRSGLPDDQELDQFLRGNDD